MGNNELITEAKEQLQYNLLCFFDGLSNDVLTEMCDIIVNTMNSLLEGEYEQNI